MPNLMTQEEFEKFVYDLEKKSAPDCAFEWGTGWYPWAATLVQEHKALLYRIRDLEEKLHAKDNPND